MNLSDGPEPYREIVIDVPVGVNNERLDRYLGGLEKVGLTRTRVQKLIDKGWVLVDGKAMPSRYLLKGGEKIQITVVPPPLPDLKGENIPLDVVFEDDFLAVINKPAGMVTHPGAGNFSGTLVNALVYHFKNLSPVAGADRPGIVHRLDKDTSGLLVIAKKDEVYLSLQQQIQTKNLKRTYHALVCGHMPQDEGEIDLPIGRSIKDRTKMIVTNVASREAVTRWKLADRFRAYDLVEINLLTGRTHQIRVHFAHLGHPVFGDPEYGGREKWHRGVFGPERPLAKQLLSLIDRQALHAKQISFVHPVTKELLTFDVPLPKDFKAVLDLLEHDGR
ncbi:MAG: RluA family pseudouridine synthase [candidate division Zixibacteria bacterium]|nr:RluA family pseudouridine synthase [candidate division Zixibacteria bacterium]